MKRVLIVLLAIVALGCNEVKKPALSEDAVAMVFDREISADTFNEEYNSFISNFAEGSLTPEIELKYKKNILESLIQREMYKVEMDKLEIEEDPDMVEKQYSQLLMRYGSKEAIESAIKGSGYTLPKLMKEFAFQTRMNNLNLYIQELDIAVEESDKKTYYEDHKTTVFVKNGSVTARHLLIKTDEGEEVALEKIKGIRKEILDGLSFPEAAKKYSQGPTGEDGGMLGNFGKGQMVPEFEEVAFTIPVQQVSGPVLTQFGYHLIYVEDRVEDEIATYEEAEDFITNHLKREKYIEGLEERANVVRADWAEEGEKE